MKTVLIILMTLSFVVGCSSTSTQEQIAREKEVTESMPTRSVMSQRVKSILRNSPNLNEDQRDKFLMLHSDVMSEVAIINDELRKSKVVMFNNMVADEYDAKKIRILRKSIVKLNKKKLNVMFDAMDESKKILGLEAKNIYRDAFNPEAFDHFR